MVCCAHQFKCAVHTKNGVHSTLYMVCQFGRCWHTKFGVHTTPNFLECSCSFSPACVWKSSHNLAIVASITQNGLRHFVPHAILHLIIYCLWLQNKMAARTVKGEVFFDETKKTSASLRHQRLL